MNIVPTTAWFTVNRSCNFGCKWCYANGSVFDSKQTLTIELALRLLKIVKEMGIKHITLIGGEPTLWKHLMDFNAKCREMGIRSFLVTNAYRFSNDNFWDEYTKTPNDKISVSLKAFDGKSAKEFAGVGDFEAMKIGLGRAILRFNSGVSFLCNSFASGNLLSLARVARECGAQRVTISPCTPSFSKEGVDTMGMLGLGELVKSFTSEYEEINTLFAEKLTFAIKTPLCIWPQDFIEKLLRRKQLRLTCQFQHRSGIIFDPIGQVSACNSLANFPMGMIDENYDNAESLIRIFNSDSVVRVYNHMNSYPSEICIDCPDNSLCRGGCPLMWSVYDPKKSIPGWNVGRKKKKERFSVCEQAEKERR